MYIITFSKPLTPNKTLSEQFNSLYAAKRWEKLVKDNGYTVRNFQKVKEQ